MRKLFYILFALVLALTIACSGKKGPNEFLDKPQDSLAFVDTITIYGLACEGCSDSAVWLLPTDVSDPIRFDIVNARRHHKVFGHFKTGDYIAVVPNAEDPTVADIAIDVDQLKGTWCYHVLPTLRRGANLPERVQKMILDSMPDTIKRPYYVPMEYGIVIKRNDLASPVNLLSMSSASEDEEDANPFVYPTEDHYVAWHLMNGQLILTRQEAAHIVMEREAHDDVNISDSDSVDVAGVKEANETNAEEIPIRIEAHMVNDTTDILFLSEDSLALQFKDHVQGYYLKQGIE